MQQMLDDMNVDVDIIKRRKDRQQQGIEAIKVKIKKFINDLISEDEESANQAAVILSSGFGNIDYNAYVISELKKIKNELKIRVSEIESIIAGNTSLLSSTGHYADQSQMFDEFYANQHYNLEIQKNEDKIFNINQKLELIDEVLSYIPG